MPIEKLLKNQRLLIFDLSVVQSALLWCFILKLLEGIENWIYLIDVVFSFVVVVVECVLKQFQPQIVSQGISICLGKESIHYHPPQIKKKKATLLNVLCY